MEITTQSKFVHGTRNFSNSSYSAKRTHTLTHTNTQLQGQQSCTGFSVYRESVLFAVAHLAEIAGQVQQNGDTGRDLQQSHHGQRAENQRPVGALGRRLKARASVLHVHVVLQVTAIIISCHERALLIASSVQEVGKVRGLLYKRWVGKAAALLCRESANQIIAHSGTVSRTSTNAVTLQPGDLFMSTYTQKSTKPCLSSDKGVVVFTRVYLLYLSCVLL